MLNKIFKSLLISVFGLFFFAGTSFAVTNSTSIRLQTPASQTNQNTFNITFVALDTNPSQAVSVQCYKKGPADGGFSAFGSVINLSNGGNTDNCQVNSSVINQGNGIYQFYALVTQGSTTPQSSTVSVDFNNSTPGTPQYVGKDKISACVNRIKFNTANDSGKTVKVEIYRADKTTFDVNSGSRLGTVTVGSNQYREYDDTLVNCDTVFYYAIRAFDIYGNGSGVVGDSNITFNVTNPTTVTQQGAIPVGNGQGSALGTGTGKTGENKEVLGTESSKTIKPNESKANLSANPIAQTTNWILGHKKISFLVLLVILGLAYYLYRKYKK